MVVLCQICNKEYSSYQSRCNHMRLYHKNDISQKLVKFEENISQNLVMNKCKYCNKQYKHCSSKSKHEKKCSKLVDKIEQMEKEISLLKNQIKNNNITNINTNIITNIDNSKKLIINNFHNDNINFITDEFKKTLFQHIRFDDEYANPIYKLIEEVKFNEIHKENNNVKIKSMRSKVGYKFDNNEWIMKNKEELLNELLIIGVKLFTDFYNENKTTLHNNIHEAFKNFNIQIRNNEDLKKQITDKIEQIAYIYTNNYM